MLLNYQLKRVKGECEKGMNGKMMAFGWTIGGIAMLAAMYAVFMLMQLSGSFTL